jgi:signal-transduction protein with cAMP-binding, CBS, and nucleotidyltransferase domain
VELGQGLSETRKLGDIGTGTIVSVDESSMVRETVNLMNKQGVSSVIVTAAGKPTGIFTERDVLKRVATKGIDPKSTTVKQVMTAPLISMPHSTLVGDVLAEMYRRDIRNMPVSGAQGELIGLVSMPEILQYARAFNVDEQVRRSWKEVAELIDAEDQFTPG